MKRSLALAIPLTLAVLPDAATAGHVIVYAPRTDAFASSAAHQGPHVQQSAAHIVNGATVPGSNYSGPGGSHAGGGSVTKSTAETVQPGGVGNLVFGNSARAAADLGAGLLKASTSSYGPNNFGSPLGFAQARLDDTIFFTNTSGATQTISFTYRFDGRLFDPAGGNPGGNVSLMLSCGGNIGACFNGPNGTGQAITFATAAGAPVSLYGGPRKPEDNWNYYFGMNSGCFGENIFCGNFGAPLWTFGLNTPNVGGVVDGYIRAYLNIPTGLTSLGVRGSLNLDCRGASSCDFGNTGKFGFGALPTGIGFGSASGVFLSQIGTPGAVPEPATWAMMIGGFGAVGGALRYRRRTTAVRYA